MSTEDILMADLSRTFDQASRPLPWGRLRLLCLGLVTVNGVAVIACPLGRRPGVPSSVA